MTASSTHTGLRVLIVQHGEKDSVPGDPGLTPRGVAQARAAARWLADHETLDAIWSSPMRRAFETASIVAADAGLEPVEDDRLRERMNWNGDDTIEEFLERWRRASTDRAYVPDPGDSSQDAANRFLAALDDLVGAPLGEARTVAVVAHGGVTTDALRTLLGDEELVSRRPGIIDDGIPGGAITTLEWVGSGWVVHSIAVSPG